MVIVYFYWKIFRYDNVEELKILQHSGVYLLSYNTFIHFNGVYIIKLRVFSNEYNP
jgi:hypothetical protein